MALSERERQMLEEMEEAIRAEDPRFASQMNGAKRIVGTDRRRVVVGVVGALAGLGLVLLGINTSLWVGVAGFVLIVAAVALALAPTRGSSGIGVVTDDGSVKKKPARRPKGTTTGRGATTARAKGPKQGTFMERMEQRWEERRREGHG
ncbi:DUF3040 domain-containing protein [Janibacter sp. GS2]|uniref:DUF3040 domain-containing protein n=1 Tax=Janibacter sp. GS2 TaxID=3442646 RepID=UPI003EBE43D4